MTGLQPLRPLLHTSNLQKPNSMGQAYPIDLFQLLHDLDINSLPTDDPSASWVPSIHGSSVIVLLHYHEAL